MQACCNSSCHQKAFPRLHLPLQLLSIYFPCPFLRSNPGDNYLHSLSLTPLSRGQHFTELALVKATGALHLAKSNGQLSVLILLDMSAALDTGNTPSGNTFHLTPSHFPHPVQPLHFGGSQDSVLGTLLNDIHFYGVFYPSRVFKHHLKTGSSHIYISNSGLSP